MDVTRVSLVLVAGALLVSTCVHAETCNTAQGELGKCVQLEECPPLAALVKPNISPEERRVFRKSLCGGNASRPKMCCPYLPTDCGPNNEGKIVGGTEVELMQYPWMAQIGMLNETSNRTELFCGGSLISDRYVLTAAHCVTTSYGLVPNIVVLGEHDVDTETDCRTKLNVTVCAPAPQRIEIEESYVHEGYNNVTSAFDIALLRLKAPAEITPAVAPICLPSQPRELSRDLATQNVTVAGWGKTINSVGDTAPRNKILNHVIVPVKPFEECQAELHINPRLSSTMICAGGKRGKDSCGGDSGGPLFRPGVVRTDRVVQYGVVSFGGRICGAQFVPAVYTRVSKFMPWIVDNMKL